MWSYTPIIFVMLICLYFRFASGLKDFSTCSMDNFKYFASQYGLTCLRNTSYDMPIYKQFPPRRRRICGNSIREEGEECDCGTLRVSRNFSQFLMCVESSKKRKSMPTLSFSEIYLKKTFLFGKVINFHVF